ncbi:MAG: DMT family transporter, partial [Clostridiales bacterium]|nr:DMT family transporter [Clostridiales bacterium]
RPLRRASWSDIRGGMLLGAAFFAVMTTEMFALRQTASSTVSFLVNTAIIIVPLLKAAMERRRPGRKDLVSAGVTLVGVACLTLRGGLVGLGWGEGLCLIEALLYSCAILLTSTLSRKRDPLVLGIVQIGTMGVLSLGASLLLETPHMPQTGREWAMVLALALVCSCFGFTFQPVAQRYVSAERAGQFCALNPLSATILGTIFLHERLGFWGLIGAVLILAGILIQSIREKMADRADETA